MAGIMRSGPPHKPVCHVYSGFLAQCSLSTYWTASGSASGNQQRGQPAQGSAMLLLSYPK